MSKPIDLLGRMKHEVTKGVISAIFKEAGYRVISTGMENVLREITLLNPTKFKTFDLAPAFKHLPDFIIADPDMKSHVPVEVNFRGSISSKMLVARKSRLEHYGAFTLIVANGAVTNPPPIPTLDTYIRYCDFFAEKGGMVELRVKGQKRRVPLNSTTSMDIWEAMVPLSHKFQIYSNSPAAPKAISKLITAFA